MIVITRGMLQPVARQDGESQLFTFYQESAALGIKGEMPKEIVLNEPDYGNPVLFLEPYKLSGSPESWRVYRDIGGVFKLNVNINR